MTQEQRKGLQRFLCNSKNYRSDKEGLYNLIKSLEISQDAGEYKNRVTSYATEHNCSRRILDALIHEIVLEIQSDNNYSEYLYDFLTNYLDCLEGNVSFESIVKLKNDPTDTVVLGNYVRSLEWVDKDYYTD